MYRRIQYIPLPMERRRSGWAAKLEEAKKLDARGLGLLEELAAALQRRDAPGLGAEDRHRVAAEEVEPCLELLQEGLKESVALAELLHVAAGGRSSEVLLLGGCPESPEEVRSLLLLADFVEQDVQMKEELLAGVSQASDAEEITAIQVLWGSRPWLNHWALDGFT